MDKCNACYYYQNKNCILTECINEYRKNKCEDCLWGTFIDVNRYWCMLPRCNRNLSKTME